MVLPADFDETLSKISRRGILAEDPATISERLDLSLKEIGGAGEGTVVDLGIMDWATKLRRGFEAAIRQELCDPEKHKLKDQYDDLLKKGLTPEGVAAVGPVVLKAVSAVNPAFAVSTVAIYFAIWLLKVGLNHWCDSPR